MRNELAPSHFSIQKIYLRILRWITHYPWIILLFTLLLTTVSAWYIQYLTVRTSIYDLVIEDLPTAKAYQQFKKLFGSDDIIRVVIKGADVFQPEFFESVSALAGKLAAVKGVRRVISLPGIKESVEKAGEWSLDKFSGIIDPVTLFQQNLISQDRKTTALTLVLESDTDTAAVTDAVQAILDTETGPKSLYQIGIPLVSEAIARFTEKDLFTILPLTFAMVALILYLLFGSLRILLITLTSVGLSIIWMFGLMALTIIPLSMLTMIVPVFLTAVGTAYSLHLITTATEYMQTARTVADALQQAFSEMALPTLLAVFTTAAGLGSLLINRIEAIQEFALFACFGLFCLLFILLFFLPALLAVFLRSSIRYRNGPGRLAFWFNRFTRAIARIDIKYQKPIWITTAIIVLFSIIGVFQVRVETNPVSYFRQNTDISRNFHDIYQDLSGSFPINVVLTGNEEDFFETPANLKEIEKLQRFLETLPGVDKTVSFADYLRLVNYTLNRYDPKFYTLPEESYEVRMLLNNYKMLLGRDMLTRFMDESYARANIVLLTHIASSRDFLEVRERIRQFAGQNLPESVSLQVTGIGMVISESSHHLVRGQINSLFLTMGIVFTAMFVLFLSGRVGIAAILSNFFPVLVTFGIMGWMGIELSMATGLIASIAIGLAVDDTIHYLVRYNQEFKKDLDKDRALTDTIQRIGKPIVFTSVTISLGFSLLLFSHFQPTAVFGLLMLITMLAALVGDLILLPAMMLHIELVTAWDLLRLMPSIGGLSAGVTHELNQPLNAIKMGAEYLKTMLQSERQIEEGDLSLVVNEIDSQVDRASTIIRRLSLFGQKPDFNKQQVMINDVVGDTLSILENQLKLENIRVETDLSQTIAPILAHTYQLGQMIYNLILNAAEAILRRPRQGKTDGRIQIRTLMENGSVTVAIADNGCGIPYHLRERIFEPFFTTKEAGKGKGLGLSITSQIVAGLQGRISVQSTKENGTTFTLRLPPADTENTITEV